MRRRPELDGLSVDRKKERARAGPFLESHVLGSLEQQTRTGRLEKANRQELSQRPIMLAGVLSAVSSAARLIQLHCHLHSSAPVER